VSNVAWLGLCAVVLGYCPIADASPASTSATFFVANSDRGTVTLYLDTPQGRVQALAGTRLRRKGIVFALAQNPKSGCLYVLLSPDGYRATYIETLRVTGKSVSPWKEMRVSNGATAMAMDPTGNALFLAGAVTRLVRVRLDRSGVPVGSSRPFATKPSGHASIAVDGIHNTAVVTFSDVFFEEQVGWLRAFRVSGSPRSVPGTAMDVHGVVPAAVTVEAATFLVSESDGTILALRWNERTRKFAPERTASRRAGTSDAVFDPRSRSLFRVGRESISRVAISRTGEPLAAGTVMPVTEDVAFPRSLACDSEHRVLYVYDSLRGAMLAYNILDNGALRPRGGKTFLPSGSFQVILPARSN
jgi:hypothetical protein